MTDRTYDEDIRELMGDPLLDHAQRVDRLKKLRDDARAEQRAATESSMAEEDDGRIGERLSVIERALDELHAKIPSPEDKGAATL